MLNVFCSPRLHLFWNIITTVLKKKTDFSPDSDKITSSLEEALLWIMDSYFGNSSQLYLMDLFVQTHIFCLLKMLTDGLEWCGLLWCFYQLFGLSFWRHPFTTEDPLVSKWCNVTFLQIWWKNKLTYICTSQNDWNYPTVYASKEVFSSQHTHSARL